jgi:SNF family Na+-dependent transporter
MFGVLTLGLNAIAQYGYPAAYSNLDSKAAWIRTFFLDLATCAAACDFFSAVKGWRWAFLYGTVITRWANPVLEEKKDIINASIPVSQWLAVTVLLTKYSVS